MNEKKLSERMCRLIESAVRRVINVACEMKQCFRLDVKIHPLAVLANQPLCVTLRLISTEKDASRFTLHPLRDKWNRQHCPTVILMEDGEQGDQLRVMFNSEYAPHHALSSTSQWLSFSETLKFPMNIVEKSEVLLQSIVDQIVHFLAKGCLNGKPYPGFQPA